MSLYVQKKLCQLFISNCGLLIQLIFEQEWHASFFLITNLKHFTHHVYNNVQYTEFGFYMLLL